MDVPKGFKPDGKDLNEHIERLLDERLVKKLVTTKIEEALRDYRELCVNNTHVPRVPEVLEYVREIKDLSLFAKKLCEPQLEGKLPLVRVLSKHYEGVTPATYDIYWNSEKEKLEFDWDDTPGARDRLFEYKEEIDFLSK